MTSISTLGQSIDQIERLKVIQGQLATLQNQLASGKKTQLFKGLGTNVIVSERSRADFKMLDSFNQNITIADRRMKMMLNSIQEIKQQAGNVVNAIQNQTQQGEIEMEAVGDMAAKVRDFIIDLLNEQDGPRYLFGGAETLDSPLNDAGTLDTYVQTQINDWVAGTITTDQFISTYRDPAQLNDTTMGYSAALSGGNAKNVFVRVEEHTEIDYTVFANDSGFRDILAALATMENVSQTLDEVTLEASDSPGTVTAPGATQDDQNDNFFQMFNDLAAMINGALDRLDQVSFNLGQSQAQISQIQENHKLEKNILLDNIADVEDVDMNEVAVKLNALQIQMEASFRVTAFLQDLSLANFLPLV